MAFLAKVPKLGDRYFRSRLTSDLASRCHNVHRLRLLPELGEGVGRTVFELVLTKIKRGKESNCEQTGEKYFCCLIHSGFPLDR